MKRHLTRLICLVLLAMPLLAQQPKNQKKGFNANDVYQFNGIDTINAFNGNLVLTLPLGISYPVGGGLSYQLSLISNANVWEAEEICRPVPGTNTNPPTCITVCPLNKPCEDHERIVPVIMHAHPRANAGIGWQVTMGRLYHPEHPAMRQTSQWTYETPDGADHPFDSGSATSIAYTTDGSYLRMRYDAVTGKRTIDFPNGQWQEFGLDVDNNWDLQRMGNQFPGNEIEFSWQDDLTYDNQAIRRWLISDSQGREQWVDFYLATYDGEMRWFVKNIWFTQFGGASRARYRFDYELRTFNRGPHHTDDTNTAQTVTLPALTSLLLPDGTGFGFDYGEGSAVDYRGGLPTAMFLPTGGKIAWVWGTYEKPSTSATSGEQYLAESTGVFSRTLFGRPDPSTTLRPTIGTWEYQPGISCEPALQTVENQCTAYTFFTNKIVDPMGTITENYFSVGQTSGIWTDLEYGQPMAKHLPDETGTRYLSTRVLRPPVAPESAPVPLRSTYTQMEHTSGKYFRQKSSRLVYEDDIYAGKKLFMDTDSSDWDGYGHYRQVRTSGSVPNTLTRTARTEYIVPPSNRWITGLFTEKSVEQDGRKTAVRYCYDETSTWALKEARTLANIGQFASPALSVKDLVTSFTYDNSGNVLEETYRGGDDTPVGLETCGSVTGTASYRIAYTYSYGSLATMKYLKSGGGFDFLSEDNDIDPSTGLVATSRDSAGVWTEFDYDGMGRFTLISPQGRAWTEYKYPPDSDGWFQIEAKTSDTVNTVTYKRYELDPFGKLWIELTTIPGGSENRIETVYDALGRKISVSEPGTATTLPQTTYTYDRLGRPLTVTSPDSSVVTYAYVGDRIKTRTQRLATPLDANKQVATTEYYDGFGQLSSVEEASGPTTSTAPNGSTVSTNYAYSAAGALTSVLMESSPNRQQRNFGYDGRGFLVWESHPENGVATYTYDSRGNVLTKTYGSSSTHDLRYGYDYVGRLTDVEGNFADGWRELKTFGYGAANNGSDLMRGKLTMAVRYNYPRAWNESVYTITDVYGYTDPAGRLSSRTTTIEQDEVPIRTLTTSVVLDERDLPLEIGYPTCTNCGMPSADADRKGILRLYDRGRLTRMLNPYEPQEIIPSVTFWPNGMRHVVSHGNGISDTQDVATATMMRPSRLRFGTYDRCVAPTISDAGQPDNQNGTPAVLDVVATGTGPFHYEWFDETGSTVVGGDTSSVTVSPTVNSRYHVVVVGACGMVRSNTVDVTSSCSTPAINSITATRQADGSFVLAADVSAKSSRTYSWKLLPALTEVGTQAQLTVAAPLSSVQYRLTVSDSCGGPTSKDVEIKIVAALESPAYPLTASVLTGRIQVSWPAVTNATDYVLERRSGATWIAIAQQNTLVFDDYDVQANKTYAYRVYAIVNGSATSSYMSSVVATTRVFAPAIPNSAITPTPSNDMLAAVNSVRAAAGWGALTWSNILAPSDPLPVPGNFVLGSHVAACRARMNEALQALGVTVLFYSPVSLGGESIRATDVNDVQQRANGGVL